MIAIDTNVFYYTVDSQEPVKQSQAADLIDQLEYASSQCVMLWQVAGEFLNCLRKLQLTGAITASKVEAYMQKMLTAFPLVLPTDAVLDISLDLSRKYSLSHWDSMLLAACLDAGVDTLYTEDMDAGTTYESLTLVNPFA